MIVAQIPRLVCSWQEHARHGRNARQDTIAPIYGSTVPARQVNAMWGMMEPVDAAGAESWIEGPCWLRESWAALEPSFDVQLDVTMEYQVLLESFLQQRALAQSSPSSRSDNSENMEPSCDGEALFLVDRLDLVAWCIPPGLARIDLRHLSGLGGRRRAGHEPRWPTTSPGG
ncbi:hypothetical protein E4U53_005041 [Claviceps sorghi]|nr:hypothetical protein E4U53_005041 [Claviceps sorghi]